MKSIIEFGLTIVLMGYVAGNLPKITRNAKLGQIHLIRESGSAKWGRPWVPKSTHP